MAPDKEKAQKELQAYALQVKDELTARQQSSRELFTKQMDSLGQRPEPAVWNAAWKEKLEAKEKEMKDQKEAILADSDLISGIKRRMLLKNRELISYSLNMKASVRRWM